MTSLTHEECKKRKAIKDRIRPKVRAKLLEYCDENGFVMQPLPEELVRQGRTLRLFKTYDLGPNPQGFKSWWFVRLTTEKNYTPPNLTKYGNGSCCPAFKIRKD